MAIKVSGTTVIDDSRNIQNVGILTATSIIVGAAVTISSSGINVVGIITASSDIQIGTKSVATTGKAIAMAMVFG